MAESKPATLASFVKDKPIVSVKHCCATLNWLISCAKELCSHKGRGVKVSGFDAGKPQIDALLEAGSGIKVEDGTADAAGNIPKKLSLNIVAGDGVSIAKGTDGAVTISSSSSGKTYSFSSAADSNVKFTVSESDNIVSVTVGVYYT